MKKTIAFALAILAIFLGGCTQIDTGNVGVERTMGQVKTEVMQPGVYLTMFKSVTEVVAKETPLSMDDLKPQTEDKITLQDLDIDLYIQIDPSKAAVIMTKWPGDILTVKGEEGSRIGFNYVSRQAREAIFDVVAKHNSATVHTERASIASDLVKTLQDSLDKEAGKGLFFVRSANVKNLVTDPALEANIKSAAQAQFKLQSEKNLLEVAKVEADRKRAEAQGEADAIRIKAEAVSKQGGEEYVKLKAIEKWDGKLPATNAGGAIPLLNLK